MVAKTPKRVTLQPKKKGQKKITFKPGGLHSSLKVPKGQPIPPSKMQAALQGAYGAKAKKQAAFAKNVLVGRKTKKRKAASEPIVSARGREQARIAAMRESRSR